MSSTIYAYAFLKAAYGSTISNPIDAIRPLVKRALIGSKEKNIDQMDVQRRIKQKFGIEIPLNVIRYTFPKLRQENVLHFESGSKRYVLASTTFSDEEVLGLEEESKKQYQRVLTQVRKQLVGDYRTRFDAAGVVEDWLDNSCLSFLGGANPAFSAGTNDYEVNRIILLAIQDLEGGQEFLKDLMDLAIGDSLYQAIKAVTELDTGELQTAELAYKSRMDEVRVFFDTPFVFRVLGFSHEELVRGANEVLVLSKNVGCKVSIFEHTLHEMQRTFQGEIQKIVSGQAEESDIAHYASTKLKDAGSLLEESMRLEESVLKAGFEIIPAPDHEVTDYALDEMALDARLRIDLPGQADITRNTDIDSLVAIYNLRKGEGFRFLEKSKAIFITTNKGLADSAVKFFRQCFQERNQKNSVQVCMTDVVFATRVWTKLPTSMRKLPRDQIISHVMANLKPSKQLRERFLRYLSDAVAEGVLSQADAVNVRLTGLVDEILVTEYEAGQQSMSRAECHAIYEKVLEKQAMLMGGYGKVDNEEVRAELTKASAELARTAEELGVRSEEVESLCADIDAGNAKIQAMEDARRNLDQKFNRLVTRAYWVLTSVFLFFALESLLELSQEYDWVFADSLKAIGNLGSTIVNIVLTVVTLYGLSLFHLHQKMKSWCVTKVMGLVFDSSE